MAAPWTTTCCSPLCCKRFAAFTKQWSAEYFLNARIVGGEIHARAWELLLAMLLMEAAFGLAGLVAAPVFYAYIKRELLDQGWI